MLPYQNMTSFMTGLLEQLELFGYGPGSGIALDQVTHTPFQDRQLMSLEELHRYYGGVIPKPTPEEVFIAYGCTLPGDRFAKARVHWMRNCTGAPFRLDYADIQIEHDVLCSCVHYRVNEAIRMEHERIAALEQGTTCKWMM